MSTPFELGEKRGQLAGSRAVWLVLLGQALSALGSDHASRQGWILERERIIIALRSICALYGDNDWYDDTSLDEVIKHHLTSHLTKDKFSDTDFQDQFGRLDSHK